MAVTCLIKFLSGSSVCVWERERLSKQLLSIKGFQELFPRKGFSTCQLKKDNDLSCTFSKELHLRAIEERKSIQIIWELHTLMPSSRIKKTTFDNLWHDNGIASNFMHSDVQWHLKRPSWSDNKLVWRKSFHFLVKRFIWND